MNHVSPYFNFAGQCGPAMTAYQEWLGGDLMLIRIGDSPAAEGYSGSPDDIYHATLTAPNFTLMGSDMNPVAQAASIVASASDLPELGRLYAQVKEGGNVHCALAPAPWGGHYAQVTDRFGTAWHLTCD
ncbi:MAG: VOC family protein [Armatimonadetes bacterium]|nr:VOC family protein [Armatimonadota bacterium]